MAAEQDRADTYGSHHHGPIIHRTRYLAGALLMLSTVALATDQLYFAVGLFVVGVVLIATSYDWSATS